jgi:hypothetical protein
MTGISFNHMLSPKSMAFRGYRIKFLLLVWLASFQKIICLSYTNIINWTLILLFMSDVIDLKSFFTEIKLLETGNDYIFSKIALKIFVQSKHWIIPKLLDLFSKWDWHLNLELLIQVNRHFLGNWVYPFAALDLENFLEFLNCTTNTLSTSVLKMIPVQ